MDEICNSNKNLDLDSWYTCIYRSVHLEKLFLIFLLFLAQFTFVLGEKFWNQIVKQTNSGHLT